VKKHNLSRGTYYGLLVMGSSLKTKTKYQQEFLCVVIKTGEILK
jgi:hypothetical protein